MVNKGFEFSVNAEILKNPHGLNWGVNANLSTLSNKITKLYGGDVVNPTIDGIAMSGMILRQEKVSTLII